MSAASARRTIARPREQIDHAHGKWRQSLEANHA